MIKKLRVEEYRMVNCIVNKLLSNMSLYLRIIRIRALSNSFTMLVQESRAISKEEPLDLSGNVYLCPSSHVNTL